MSETRTQPEGALSLRQTSHLEVLVAAMPHAIPEAEQEPYFHTFTCTAFCSAVPSF